jgi:hypothetical protein
MAEKAEKRKTEEGIMREGRDENQGETMKRELKGGEERKIANEGAGGRERRREG